LPEAVDLGRKLLPRTPYHKGVRDLHGALVGCDPSLPLGEREAGLERLVAWIRDPAPPPAETPRPEARSQHARLAIVLETLAAQPELAARVGETLAGVLTETSAVHLFAEVGVPSDRGLLDETLDRLAQRLLPRAREEHELSDCVLASLPNRRDAEWLADLPGELVDGVVALVPAESWAALVHDLGDAARLLATRIAALGLSEEIRARSEAESLDRSPFYALPRAVDTVVAEGGSPAAIAALGRHCRRELEVVHAHLELAGVSVDIVYRMDAITRSLERLEALATLLGTGDEALTRRQRAPALLAELVLAGVGDRSLRKVLGENTKLLARKVIERVGSTGEHYITRSRRQWWAMLRSAAGGGVLTAGTAMLKFVVTWAKLPMFVEGFALAANYGGSFLLMQLLGFTLATKQPSMTAAALANALRLPDVARRVDEMVTMIARMTRSQLAAALGNVGAVVPTAMFVDTLWVWQTGAHFLDEQTAAYVLGSLHPTESKTIGFAFLTGVFLWLASLGAGWLENWAVYRRLPEAIEQHRIRRVIGDAATRRLANGFRKHVAGAGGSITLGALLAFMPVIGKGFGLPIDVRHVTLSAGSLTFATCSLGWHTLGTGAFLAAAVGVAIIGTLNFGVSFVFALWVAMRARGVGTGEKVGVVKGLLGRVFRRPMEFIFPGKHEPDGDEGHV
jgi:site-specific recombinase